MTNVLQAEFLMQSDDGNEYYLSAYEVESISVTKVMGNMLHESKTQVIVTLPPGAELELEAIIEPEDEEDDDDED
jgi:hypothetical protein